MYTALSMMRFIKLSIVKLYGSAVEELMLHRVCDDKSRCIEEKAEIVGPV